jgi:peptidoglycan/xylan/chitin deacetylase (PgdA/CDA1 family)
VRDRQPRRSLPVLTFHAIDDVRAPVSTTPAALRGYLATLAAAGWRTLSLDEAVDGHARGAWPPGAFVLTFDDGYRSVLEQAAPIVAECGFTAAVFVISDRVGGTMARYGAPPGTAAAPLLDWAELRRLSQAGWTIGSHSRAHPMLPALPSVEVERELLDSKRAIEDQIGGAVNAFAYPYGAANRDVEAIAALHYRASFGTRLARVTAASRLTNLERIDAYYLRRFSMARRLDTSAGVAYLALRHLARAIVDRTGLRTYSQ